MTVRELSKYYKLHERLERNKEMLTSLSAAAGLKAQVIDGMPHAPGVSDKVGDMAVELADLKETIAALEFKCDLEKRKVKKYISKISDDRTRMIFSLRFIHCMTWQEVADTLGGRNSANGVKHICYRYIDDN